MVGHIDLFDAAAGFGEFNPPAVDVLAFRNDPRDGAKAPGHPRGAGVGIARKLAREHARVEFIGLAVEVDIAPRHERPQHRGAMGDAGQEELVDETVLGAPQGLQRQARLAQEMSREVSSAVGRIEHRRRRPLGRRDDLEGGCPVAVGHDIL